MTDRRFGATYAHGQATFSVWAPSHEVVKLKLRNAPIMTMPRDDDGWHEITVACSPGDQYQFEVDDQRIVDPAANQQAHGRILSWSVVTDPARYVWQTQDWRGRPWNEVVLYEAHAGLFGGFKGLQGRLQELKDIGFTAVELMPIAQFPGSWNWGYDGVLPFAPDRTYGTTDDLKALVDAAHGLGLMIFLDVVYNHFGPDGNYLHVLAPEFFRNDIETPWGAPIDFRRPQVRQFFVENACTWISEFRFDGLRFDAVHAIEDEGWLPEMAAQVRALAPHDNVHFVLENDNNEADLLRNVFDAQWNDDYHHVLHVMLTGERDAYYADYATDPAQKLARAMGEGYVYQGDPSDFRGGALRGSPSADLSPLAFVNFLQNHDQIGNRAFGDRLTVLADEQALRAAIALLLLSPAIPLVFMGEEIGSQAPFHYFVDHTPELVEAIREGRMKEFEGLVTPGEDLPEPNAPETYEQSNPEADAPRAREWRAFYKRLLDLRHARIMPHLAGVRTVKAEAIGQKAVAARWRLDNGEDLLIAANLDAEPVAFAMPEAAPIWGVASSGTLPGRTTLAWIV